MEKIELTGLIRNPDGLNEETLMQVKSLVVTYPLFQTGWMLLLRNLKNIGSPDFTGFLKKAAPRVADRRLLYQYLHPEQFRTKGLPGIGSPVELDLNQQSDADQSKGRPSKQALIIDDFLKNQPTIRIRASANEGDRPDLSERSASEHDDFLTETLAEIYLKQNNFKKAIESFEKLSLKFPEKSIYFAGRIEEIKQLLNN